MPGREAPRHRQQAGARILADWAHYRARFVKVMPTNIVVRSRKWPPSRPKSNRRQRKWESQLDSWNRAFVRGA